ncbi:hypothetical protein NHQ30_007463 [Ciborinia camelliae]|nr:hypothetical protein NHQ30_007463 [Ciborinia camelliae]
MSSLKPSIVDALIIGSGPAGLAAALGLCRIRRTAVLFDSGKYRNGHVHHMHNVNTWDHASPSDYRSTALRELLDGRYNTVLFAKVTIQSVARSSEDGTFTATDETGKTWHGKKLIIATGVTDILPEIPGYTDCWSNSNIYHCLFCHGYEDSGASSAAILAIGNMASPMSIHFAKLATQFAEQVTIYTNNSTALAESFKPALANNPNISIDNRSIKALITGGPVKGPSIVFDSDEVAEHAFFAHQPKVSPNIDFAKGLGLTLSDSGTEIKTTAPFYETDVKGCFAVGDNSVMFRTVIMAMAAGTSAASGVSISI